VHFAPPFIHCVLPVLIKPLVLFVGLVQRSTLIRVAAIIVDISIMNA
jgi:hypothetical protein